MLSRDYSGNNIVFIVGCPRSGTTLLRKLLASNPKVRSGKESNLFSHYLGSQIRSANREFKKYDGEKKPATGLSFYLNEREFWDILKGYMLKLIEPMVSVLSQDEIFVEKTPEHSFFIKDIAAVLPQAKIIHILRDGRDVVSSLLAVSKSSWGRRWAPRNARTAARLWVNYVETVRAYSKDISAEQFSEITYEDLVGRTEQVLRNVSSFVGINWDEKVLTEVVEKSNTEARSADGNYETFVRRAKAGSWKKDLSFYDKILVWLIARNTLEKVGYAWRYPW